jgi:hypothetical protein
MEQRLWRNVECDGGLELKTSGWRFWRDDQGELLFKYKELHPAQNKTPD